MAAAITNLKPSQALPTDGAAVMSLFETGGARGYRATIGTGALEEFGHGLRYQ